ncbi:DMSO reductase iron-sulfur subunit [Slackia heliotrinireducens]|uniref:Fe-S-cluster-containing hydrogenase subunit n=1 Tax=Slackia heliotrinireducens (strain ATCC 29202 / DSM 20476 / NCTC 11029 / RHS 1) TaxID=471855 RepID=C7N4L4_SLAHD|nr:4Fe-4S dicluster domain-containing protein [Slackia heliotrinireducens]ACV21849.1 Fe-S-cluster-containing hydrogenase subunit [Slackia heliotrinireducens DSM 20476]VEG99595.1 DMSO reductase iron-sulfur subunit [Slackia heliotrinireducens]
MTKYAIVVDEHRCIGCWSCSVACKLENNLPDQSWWNTVLTVGGDSVNTPAGEYGKNTITFNPYHCMHCDTPACTAVCPTGATYKDEETGIVMQNVSECIGCRSCIEACPYTGVRTYLEEDPIPAMEWPVGNQQAPDHLVNTVEKCIMCYYRVKDGKDPACVEGCPAYARVFGDLDDPESEVSKLLAEREYYVLNPEAGTGPNVYYLKDTTQR